MATEGIRLDDGGARRSWPLLVPRALLEAYQPLIGPTAAMLWINLYSLAESTGAAGGVTGAAPGAGGFASRALVDKLARRMGVEPAEVEAAAAALESVGLLRREAGEWVLAWPAAGMGMAAGMSAPAGMEAAPVPAFAPTMAAPAAALETVPPAAAARGPAAVDAHPEVAAERWDSMEAALSAVVAFYHQRIGLLGPSQYEKLRFWVEDQGMSPEVVAMAIEETVQSARTPRMSYLEAILRNWYNEGIRTLDDLQRSQRARALRQAAPVEGTPNAGAYQAVDAEAVKRWKEMFADEYDG